MAGLLEKDIRLLWGTKQTLVILFAIAVAVAFSGNGNFIIGYLPFVVEMIAISTIAYDEMDHGYQFLLTLPINKKTYVREKYLLCAGGVVATWVIAVCLYLVSKVVRGIPVVVAEDMLTAAVILLIILLISFFMIPAQIKFGCEKSRILTLGMMGVIAAIAYLCEVVFGKERLYQALTVIDNMNVAVLAGNIIGITLLTLFISYQISRRIMMIFAPIWKKRYTHSIRLRGDMSSFLCNCGHRKRRRTWMNYSRNYSNYRI